MKAPLDHLKGFEAIFPAEQRSSGPGVDYDTDAADPFGHLASNAKGRTEQRTADSSPLL